jgi:hypothetical protein
MGKLRVGLRQPDNEIGGEVFHRTNNLRNEISARFSRVTGLPASYYAFRGIGYRALSGTVPEMSGEFQTAAEIARKKLAIPEGDVSLKQMHVGPGEDVFFIAPRDSRRFFELEMAVLESLREIRLAR